MKLGERQHCDSLVVERPFHRCLSAGERYARSCACKVNRKITLRVRSFINIAFPLRRLSQFIRDDGRFFCMIFKKFPGFDPPQQRNYFFIKIKRSMPDRRTC
ncbi:hypothetical protein EVAR_77100_1 [Eumeta japonica]|uniref:Uncharacterized protein n=1 Tax=Eumeta variegata TaxID=151549 RepID=A0A4C1T554_EUMVA|nr:hypothetical protein EVAR_77100_1 [Eumeta japonica]